MALSIKDHIEAGHYPKDEKGRALVPMRSGGTALIFSTEGPEWSDGVPRGIVGIMINCAGRAVCTSTWMDNGLRMGASDPCDLLPPPPRKVVVKGYLLLRKGGGYGYWQNASEAARCAHNGDRLVELTGEYEEPWT